ncbi:Na(+)/H(+) exchanger beta,Sodium/hydrogen exchanger 3,Sodium/hydrogen exchanger 2,Na(+)/H(+) exchanger protein 7,Sodium/hydrogen exchanger 1 [Mytilus coruscus]|uniref:Sodium/hydrogen exchanger n=1 Tax=Mytilus coruscus TaxID=42192 RepID=A0A6J8AA13_MYTCO|nr:Na(+)/H(+) exchanger beta,Sodium/hydrogen exchanger 3,Sodium/hydrogen exchanger 2,Na(+)/H(+) exchanger protein 7,Sodium/hydrogen exchanger 1 [Mytilus coruscus]
MENINMLLSLFFIWTFCFSVCVCNTGGLVTYQPKPNAENSSTKSNETPHDGNNTDHHRHIHGVEIAEWKFQELREPFIFTIVVLLAGLSKIGFHYTDKLSSHVPESCLLIVIGTAFGVIFFLTGISEKLPEFFTPDTFFHFLLPPIILEAAFSLYDRTFLHNLGSILIFSVIGTCCAAFTIGLCLIGLHKVGAMEDIDVTPIQLLVFSSLIVAVDPVAVLAVFNEVGVNRVLYFLVFGESLLNDGVTVVLYNVMQSYNSIALQGGSITAMEVVLGIVKFLVVCIGGLAIGVICGILSSILTRFTDKVKVVEPVAIFGMAYLAFILAEMFHFSGIISIIACGLIQVAYAFNNLNRKSCTAIKYFTRVMSSTTEIIIFMFLGLLLVRDNHRWETGFILWTLFLCIVVRFFYTYLFSLAINRFDRSRVRRITLDEMFIMSYGGLRGAVCFSLVALLKPEDFPTETKNLFVTATLTVILFSVFVQGATIKPLVNKLRVKLATYVEPKMYDELNCKVTDHMMAGMEEIVGHEGNFYLMEKMKRFQDLYLRKYLLNDPEGFDQSELLQYYEKLVMKEHYRNLHLCGAKNMPDKSEDMRKIDSSAMLLKLANGTDAEEPEEEEEATGVVLRIKSIDSPTPSDLRKLLESHATHSRMPKIEVGQRFCSAIPQGMFDRNMAKHTKFSMMQHLQNKRCSNMRLQRMKSIRTMPERALSWSEEDSDICFRRGNQTRLGKPKTRSATVDISPTDDRHNITSVMSNIMDTVFEEDEIENRPLLKKGTSLPVYAEGTSHPKVESGITVISPEEFGDTFCVPNKSNEPENVASVTDYSDEPKPGMPSGRKNSSHVLTRQGAMDDIPMKKISRSTSQ